MRERIRRFLDWMEVSPAYLTLWFLPLVAILYVYAKLKNTLKGNS